MEFIREQDPDFADVYEKYKKKIEENKERHESPGDPKKRAGEGDGQPN